jgi:hypothetical protein
MGELLPFLPEDELRTAVRGFLTFKVERCLSLVKIHEVLVKNDEGTRSVRLFIMGGGVGTVHCPHTHTHTHAQTLVSPPFFKISKLSAFTTCWNCSKSEIQMELLVSSQCLSEQVINTAQTCGKL